MLDIAGLTKRFDDAKDIGAMALSDIALSVGAHEFVSIVGTSGSGKSTLLRLIAGLERPSAGRLDLNGRPVTGPTPDVAIVFQEPRLMPWLTVRDNIRIALLDLARKDLTRKDQDARIGAALEQVGLSGSARAMPRHLSGGMAQRVAIARALVRRPSVLLLDEPFGALDNFTRIKLQDHVTALWTAARFAVILVTHDVEEAVVLSDRIVVMHAHPGHIHATLAIDLPRPRFRTAAAVQALKDRVVQALDLS